MATMGQVPTEKPSMSLWDWIKEHLLPDFFVKVMSRLFFSLRNKL